MKRQKLSGIYYIKNTSNGFRVYIGSSIDIVTRLINHFSALRRGVHRCKHLQRVFDKYGEDSMDFGIIAVGIVNNLRVVERQSIEEFLSIFPRHSLMNSTLNTECPLDDPEVRVKQKQAAKDFWNNNHRFREDTIERGKERFGILCKDPEFCTNRDTRLTNLNKGEDFQKHRIEALLKVCGKPVMCSTTGEVFASGGLAAEWLRGIGKTKASQSAVGACCRGQLKSAYGYKWEFV